MNKIRMGLIIVSICLFVMLTVVDVRAVEKVGSLETNEVEVTVKPDDNEGSKGIMDDDIVIIEEDVIGADKKLAPNPSGGYEKELENKILADDSQVIDKVPKTSDDNNIYLYLASLVIILIGMIYVYRNQKLKS